MRYTLEELVKGNFKNDYRLQIIDAPLTLREEHGSKCGNPGNKLFYTGSDGVDHYATCGAFVRDEHDKLYILSSCHGHSPTMCYFMQPVPSPMKHKRHPCKLVASVYERDPLLDAVLYEVYTKGLKSIVEPVPHQDQPKSHALCGMYEDPIEDLVGQDEENVIVMKYEGKKEPAKGTLSFYKFENPSEEISDALVIAPVDTNTDSFSSEGDSGSLVLLDNTHTHSGKYENYSLHEGLGMLCYGVDGLYPGVKCSLAFKLDNALEVMRQKTKMKLHLLPFDHEVL